MVSGWIIFDIYLVNKPFTFKSNHPIKNYVVTKPGNMKSEY